jgi:predicted O-linked N-acetylglucosamine transferase (SPINDLY family)
VQLDSRAVTPAQAIEIALAHHRAGRLPEAEAIYRQVLEAEPENFQALHLLGAAAHQRGAHELAVSLLEKADRLAPARPEILVNLAGALRATGRTADAERGYRAALAAAPAFAPAYSRLGVLLRDLGRREEAAHCLQEALRLEPGAEGHGNLGLLLQELGRNAEAEQHLRRALALGPANADFHYNLGNILRAGSRAAEAAESYLRALELRPGFALAWNNLGTLHKEALRLDEAERCYRAALEADAGRFEAHYNLAALLRGRRRHAEAESCLRAALALRHDYPEAHNELGKLLNQLDRLEEAERALREALALRPDYADAWNNLGIALQRLGRLDEAEKALDRALALWPDFAQAQSNRGVLLHVQRRLSEAEHNLRRAVALMPDYAEAHNNLGVVLKDLGRSGEAEEAFTRSLALKPEYAGALSNLAEVQKDSGRPEEAVASYRRALALEPENAWMHSNLLLTLSYCPGITLAALAGEHAEFERRHAAPLRKAWAPHGNSRHPDRKLRLGFVTPDLGLHPIGYLMADVLERLDRGRFEAFVYSSRWLKDVQTLRLMQSVEHWCDVVQLSDEALAAQIRADAIDVLFDLSGHTAQNRLLVFARRPAPVQVTWMGYAGSTGMKAMDYLLTDANLVPGDCDRHYAETVIRLEGAPATYRLPAEIPEIGPLPALRNGFVTFGSFNNPAKINAQVVALWSAILMRLPAARLVLKYLGFDDPVNRERYAKLFAAAGVDPSRLTFLGFTPMADMFARYNEVDVALDPFPYTGGTTTLLALAMGVPVVSLAGDTMPGRQSLTMLGSMGLESFVAKTAAEYEARAVSLAGDLPQLRALRAGLRERVLRSQFFDPRRFVQKLERTVRGLWVRWCKRLKCE